ncbi:hypothetical protein ASG43_20095 [Aureimonas sp. Leaf454]|uniref:DUF6492 family protein n=1 Tax=Aureimonas sp. Leaf454 TaxID=1736381 RepID=UPI0007023C8E|nr:DUF6492 family protein [Aureimonas sp. Leaf454]KQT52359.1 hypothetical protein ASG43_20095 [Aureimonas sp. Leaf454]
MSAALVTASYRGDLERCRLLCESIDARVSGYTRHLILVEAADLALFRPLAGPRREIVSERELLPSWLRAFPDPSAWGRRRLWLSPFGPPLRGWHVQQLRRIAIAALLDERVMVSLDSDVVFVRPFDVGVLEPAGATEFYRQPHSIPLDDPAYQHHRAWSRRAAELLGLSAPLETQTDYIATVIAWRTASVRAMTAHIEAVTGKSWMRALVGSRSLSECMLYGRFVEEVERRPDLHQPSTLKRCRIYWNGAALGEGALSDFTAALEPEQVAVGIQSFTGTDPVLIRRAAGLG